MRNYLSLLEKCLEYGEVVTDERTNIGTKVLIGEILEFDLCNSVFPIITTKKINFNAVVVELLWFLRGNKSIKFLHENNVHIWDTNVADYNKSKYVLSDMSPGKIYGYQWRSWGGTIDQLENVIHSLSVNPYSRRHVVSSWNPSELHEMALPPCHTLFQFNVTPPNKLHCTMYQRSGDLFLGVPFNISSYALLTHIVAKLTNLVPTSLKIFISNVHLYLNHIEQAKKQLKREPFRLPFIEVNICSNSIEKIIPSDIRLIGYQHHPYIKAPLNN